MNIRLTGAPAERPWLASLRIQRCLQQYGYCVTKHDELFDGVTLVVVPPTQDPCTGERENTAWTFFIGRNWLLLGGALAAVHGVALLLQGRF